jgi:hypothetical protein
MIMANGGELGAKGKPSNKAGAAAKAVLKGQGVRLQILD